MKAEDRRRGVIGGYERISTVEGARNEERKCGQKVSVAIQIRGRGGGVSGGSNKKPCRGYLIKTNTAASRGLEADIGLVAAALPAPRPHHTSLLLTLTPTRRP